ncbi:hypothetical protein NQ315_016984 [Exocentrus adspersus]|uniref:Uncharacterized protein n=1 Tax=Exocentrus adspersus TaxID=1586481 RepID=A0AAV8V8C7_9CUCU|nr:hypothetical protein NQ315_016984 [Exocentrus adspersus]
MHIIYSRFTIYILEILNSESPDLNPLDFYVWGYLKDKVYATPVLTRDDLVQRIQEACNEMRQNPNQVSDAVNSLIRRCHKCIEVGGQHFEQLREIRKNSYFLQNFNTLYLENEAFKRQCLYGKVILFFDVLPFLKVSYIESGPPCIGWFTLIRANPLDGVCMLFMATI